MKRMKFVLPILMTSLLAAPFLSAGCGMGRGPGQGGGCGMNQRVGGQCRATTLPDSVQSTLSAEQRAKVEALEKARDAKRASQCQKVSTARAALVPANPSGDKAWAEYRKNLDAFQKLRAECREQALAHQDAIAKILTPAQRSAWLAGMNPTKPCPRAQGGATNDCGRGPSACPNR